MMFASPNSGVGANNGGASAALDKILGGGEYANATCGRIVPVSGAQAPGRATPASNVSDLVYEEWADPRSCPSDHLPIYVNIGNTSKQGSAAPSELPDPVN